MASSSLQIWINVRCVALDEIESAHKSIGGSGRGRRYATQQINYAYTMLLSSQFQAFCRDLHSECAKFMVQGIGSLAMSVALRNAIVRNRKLDRGNPNPGNLGSDFDSFGISFWDEVRALDHRNRARQTLLEEMCDWRNAIAHQDFSALGGGSVLQLRRVRTWRAACHQLGLAFDEAMRQHLQALTSVAPW